MTSRRVPGLAVSIGGSLAILILTSVITPLIGSSHIDYGRAFAGASPDHEILFYARIPRVILALLAGAGLSATGVLFQALLRDPLAEPYTLGISSGASFGAVLALCFGFTTIAGLPGVPLASTLGAGAVLLIVLGLAYEGRRISSFTLLLAGVTINSISLALILFLHNLSTFQQSFAITRWMMGGLDAIDYGSLVWLGAIVLLTCTLVCWRARDWNLLAVGEDWASTRGVASSRLTVIGYIAGSIMTGFSTALTGPIGFVGLIVPHALRLWLGADHRRLLPCSILLGAAFLAICDTVSRTILAPTEIPVGVITALIGGPSFIGLLRSKRRSLWL